MQLTDSLILDSIKKRIAGKDILRDCYLKVEKKSITALTGKNGSGKSTLLKIAAGQINTDEGLTIINSQRFHKPKKLKRYKYIGYLPQRSSLNKYQKVNTYLTEYINSSLEDSFIDTVRNKRIRELSFGDRRYLETTIVLALDRDYFLLDEPFSGLEPLRIEVITNHILKRKREGRGILLSDHYSHYVNQISDISYIMNDGICRLLSS